jgi:NCAIR mutase (PurE)-related protein
MQRKRLERLLEQLREGKIEIQTVLDRLKTLPYESLGFASVDHHRSLRQGFPEVIYCPGKTIQQITGIAKSILKHQTPLLATRADRRIYQAIKRLSPRTQYHPEARAVTVPQREERKRDKRPGVLIITAGTADVPVAEEARVTLELLGDRAAILYDVGVAGIHRLLDKKDLLLQARVIIAVAGMDGALPSVIGGLVEAPLIAVPTSTGYGTGLGGLAALLTMLNSCANGIAVMNIDNGFGAACLAHRINRL